MKKAFLKPLAAVAAAALLVGCTLPGARVQDDDYYNGDLDTSPAKNNQIINYVWQLEPSIAAENIIVFDGSQVDPDATDKSEMYERLAVISRSGVYGLIDYGGNIIVQPNYKYYFLAPNGQIVLYNTLDEKGEQREYCTLDEDGKVTDQYYGESSARVKYYYDEENKSIYYAKESEEWNVHRYEDKKTVVAVKADVLDNGMSIEVVEPDPGTERYGMVNQDGVVLDFEYESFYAPTFKGTGVTAVALKKDGKWGYVDSKGAELIGFNCDEVFSSYNGELTDDPNASHPYLYSEEFVPVSINYSFGYYNMEGKCVVKSIEFSQARPVHHGKAWVSNGNAWGVIRFGEEEEEETTTTTTTASSSSSTDSTYYTDAPFTVTKPIAPTPTDDSEIDTEPWSDTEPSDDTDTTPWSDTEPDDTEPWSDTDPYTDPEPVDPEPVDPDPWTDPEY